MFTATDYTVDLKTAGRAMEKTANPFCNYWFIWFVACLCRDICFFIGTTAIIQLLNLYGRQSCNSFYLYRGILKAT
jgi:hypothetical protein